MITFEDLLCKNKYLTTANNSVLDTEGTLVGIEDSVEEFVNSLILVSRSLVREHKISLENKISSFSAHN